jgi:hypothetical protein
MINISKHIYVGYDPIKPDNSLPQAEIIPKGDSIAEKKKLLKLQSTFPQATELSNQPLPGFTLYECSRKNYGSLDQTWLVIDPRGFMVRITNENLNQILRVTGITEGLIQDQCVWARDNSQTKMTLIPISAPSYSVAVQNTELLEEKVNFKDIQIGDKVLLQNELVGEYMGVATLYGPGHQYKDSMKVRSNLRRQILKVSSGKYHYQTDLKILKVLEKATTTKTREQSIKEMNDEIASGIAFFTPYKDVNRSKYYGSWDTIRHVSSHAYSSVPVELIEISKEEAINIFNEAKSIPDPFQLALEDSAGDRFLVDFPGFYSSKSIGINGFEVLKMNENDGNIVILENNGSYWRKPAKYKNIDDFSIYYKIVKKLKNENYV